MIQKQSNFSIDIQSLNSQIHMEERMTVREETIIEEKNRQGNTVNRYIKGRYLGKGGFAKCYEFTHTATGRKYAAKIIEKSTLTRSKAKEKLTSQIEIHKSVKSEYVVKYEKHFEDSVNVYILLELCTNQTLNELIKRRKRIHEIQARYYLRQISLAIKDFQEQLIIHRDLKLGNLLLTENLEIRISDFGLAAKLKHQKERRKTMCGTPNYIAPEILETHSNDGHSYEVDIWSLGVIAYACLVGRPPFETNDVKTTYTKIKMCNYSFPDHVSLSTTSKSFISKLLQKDPKHRLTIEEILQDEFFSYPIPDTLPTTLLACPPNKIFLDKYNPRPKIDLKHKESTELSSQGQKTERGLQKRDSMRTLLRTNSIQNFNNNRNSYCNRAASTAALRRGRMISSRAQLPKEQTNFNSVQAGPFVWITFFEENPKFGMAYLLNSNAIGMRFNDSTSLISNQHFQKLKYIDFMMKNNENGHEVFDAQLMPEELTKKTKIISYYQKELKNKKQTYENGLNNEQRIMREKHRFKETTDTALTIWVVKYVKTSKASVFWFNNKDIQTIFQDFTELLICKDKVTYVNKLGERTCFNMDNQETQIEEIKKRWKYTKNILKNLTINGRTTKENKENRPEEVQNKGMIRSSSVLKMEKTQTTLRGSASTSRIGQRLLKY